MLTHSHLSASLPNSCVSVAGFSEGSEYLVHHCRTTWAIISQKHGWAFQTTKYLHLSLGEITASWNLDLKTTFFIQINQSKIEFNLQLISKWLLTVMKIKRFKCFLSLSVGLQKCLVATKLKEILLCAGELKFNWQTPAQLHYMSSALTITHTSTAQTLPEVPKCWWVVSPSAGNSWEYSLCPAYLNPTFHSDGRSVFHPLYF